MYDADVIVELEGVNGEWFTLAGPDAGDRGVYLGTGITGLYDPPVKIVYEEPGNYPGARYLNHRILRRDIVFQAIILDDKTDSWLSRDSEWRKAWAYDRDCKLYITTPDSGRRMLKVRLGDAIEIDMETDPTMGQLNIAKMVVIAGDPFWYEEDIILSAKTKKDTRFNPSGWTPPWPWQELPQETLYIDVGPHDGKSGGLNPTDQYIWLKWSIPGSTEEIPNFPWPFPPGVPVPWERAPFTQWVLPDYSFEDPDYTDRRLKMPGLIIKENCIVDTDPRVEQVSSETGSQVWARMNGVRFRNAVPPYTKERKFEITVAGCKPGQTVELRLPRPWSRPWGLE